MTADLFIRIGNSSVEYAFNSKRIFRSVVGQWSKITRFIQSQKVKRVVFSSVNPPLSRQLKSKCRSLGVAVREVKSQAVPLRSPYVRSIGVDRLLNVFALSHRSRSSFVLVDLGTATTVEFFDRRKGYLGGWIAPGLPMLTHVLHDKAALLPKVDTSKIKFLSRSFGHNTQETLLLGIKAMIHGLLAEAEKTARHKWGSSRVQFFVTGGGLHSVGPFKGWKKVSGLQLEALQKIADNR